MIDMDKDKRYDTNIVWVRKEAPCYIQCFCDNELIKRCENLTTKLEDIYKL